MKEFNLIPKELQDPFRVSDVKFRDGLHKVEKCGNTTIVTSTHYGKQQIEVLPNREYVVLKTGEVLKMKPPAETRGDNLRTLKSSLARLSKLIDTNWGRYETTLTFTLTYAENMTDTKRLYKDWHDFWLRLVYKFGSKICSDYIVAFEPQGRGAWHAHACVFQNKRSFIRPETLADIWGFGFVKIGKRPKNLDSLGKYLTAYLSDVPIEDLKEVVKGFTPDQMRNYQKAFSSGGVNVETKDGHQFLKGLRMLLYPARFRFFRWSKGIEEPKTETKVIGGKQVLEFGSCVSAKSYPVEIEGKDEPLIISRFIFKRKVNPDFKPLQVVEVL